VKSLDLPQHQGAAEHFVPRARDAARHNALTAHIEQLWGAPTAEIMRCGTCGFGFVSPWVSGDCEFYRLVHQAEPHYPNNRWEFEQTLNALKHGNRQVRAVLEVGAGKGAFLEKLRAVTLDCRFVAADLDKGGVAQMRAKGIEAMVGSLADAADRGPFDAICMFQTVEHLADLDRLYATLRDAITRLGSIFISVPNGESIAVQERLTGFL
jgi:2-polyprenyl-3-methyl-5-hydroxy-6-metoxy-1,4-benzoquinol methylase